VTVQAGLNVLTLSVTGMVPGFYILRFTTADHARMRLLGAEVVPVGTGSKTLKDAMNEAMRDWVTNVESTNYVFGTVAGPHPFPLMVREYQRVIGDEARGQVLDRVGRLPDAVLASWNAVTTTSACVAPCGFARRMVLTVALNAMLRPGRARVWAVVLSALGSGAEARGASASRSGPPGPCGCADAGPASRAAASAQIVASFMAFLRPGAGSARCPAV
jgi:hypothetical protein